MRIEALDMLGDWAAPQPLDRVLNEYRPLESRPQQAAAEALEPQLDLLMRAPEPVRLKAISVAAELGIRRIAGALAKQVGQRNRTGRARADALRALARLDAPTAVRLAEQLPLKQTRGELGLASLSVLADHAASESIDRFITATTSDDTEVQQRAWDILGKLPGERPTAAINRAVQQYLEGELDRRVQLNVLQAAEGRLPPATKTQLSAHRQALAGSDPLGPWLDALAGGDPQRGKALFFGKTELSCVRCHQVGRTGGQVGPKLTTIGSQRDPRYLLESICLPDAKIAKGFETAVIVDVEGQIHGGIVKNETDQFVELVLPDGSLRQIPQAEIEARRKGNSSMPADLVKLMSMRELRDLVAYLSSLKVDPRKPTDVE
jgi:quinoprotein glucose dehydrogenase